MEETTTVSDTSADPVPVETATDKLVRLCGFTDKDKHVTKEELEVALTLVTPELLEELLSLHGYTVKNRIEKGIDTTKDLLCLLRRVLRKSNRFIFYERYKEKKKTKYKYFLK